MKIVSNFIQESQQVQNEEIQVKHDTPTAAAKYLKKKKTKCNRPDTETMVR